MVVERGYDGREHDAGGNSRFRQAFDRRQAAAGRGGPRLHAPLQFVVERGDAQENVRQPETGQFAQQVEVAFHQRGLGHDAHGMACFQHDLQQRARCSQLLFERLVAVGVDAEGDGLALVARAREFAL